MISLEVGSDIHIDDVSIFQRSSIRNSVTNHLHVTDQWLLQCTSNQRRSDLGWSEKSLRKHTLQMQHIRYSSHILDHKHDEPYLIDWSADRLGEGVVIERRWICSCCYGCIHAPAEFLILAIEWHKLWWKSCRKKIDSFQCLKQEEGRRTMRCFSSAARDMTLSPSLEQCWELN